MWSASTDLIPPVRLGRLLRERRERLGWSLQELATLHGLDAADLDALEAGIRILDEATLGMAIDVYEVEHGAIVPQRSELVIDVDEGTISAAEQHVEIGGTTGGEAVLTRYLALVYALRGLPLGAPIVFRDLDIAVLGRALDTEAGDVERRLDDLVAEIRPPLADTSRRIRRATVVPLAGLLVGLTGVGGLVLVQRQVGARAEAEGPPAGVAGLALPIVESGAAGPGVVSTDPQAMPLGMLDTAEIGDAAVEQRPTAAQRAEHAADGVDIGTAIQIERPATD